MQISHLGTDVQNFVLLQVSVRNLRDLKYKKEDFTDMVTYTCVYLQCLYRDNVLETWNWTHLSANKHYIT